MDLAAGAKRALGADGAHHQGRPPQAGARCTYPLTAPGASSASTPTSRCIDVTRARLRGARHGAGPEASRICRRAPAPASAPADVGGRGTARPRTPRRHPRRRRDRVRRGWLCGRQHVAHRARGRRLQRHALQLLRQQGRALRRLCRGEMQPDARPYLRRRRDRQRPGGRAARDRAAHDADDAVRNRPHDLSGGGVGSGAIPRARSHLLRGGPRARDPPPRNWLAECRAPTESSGSRTRPLPPSSSSRSPRRVSRCAAACGSRNPRMARNSSAWSRPRSRCSSPTTAVRRSSPRRTAGSPPGCR